MDQEMPDPAAAVAAGSDKDPMPLQDQIQELNVSGQDGVDLDQTEQAHEKDGIDRDDLVAMVVASGASGVDNMSSRVKSPASFFQRPAYVSLHDKNLTLLPNLPGAGIFYHNASNQWHSAWKGGNRAPSWKPGLRTEKEALLLALIALWEKYLLENSSDEEAKTHLSKLQKELHLSPALAV